MLVIWFVFSLLAPWFARELDGFSFLGFKLGYYLIVQGSLIVFVLLIVVQNMIQDRIDDAYGAGSSTRGGQTCPTQDDLSRKSAATGPSSTTSARSTRSTPSASSASSS